MFLVLMVFAASGTRAASPIDCNFALVPLTPDQIANRVDVSFERARKKAPRFQRFFLKIKSKRLRKNIISACERRADCTVLHVDHEVAKGFRSYKEKMQRLNGFGKVLLIFGGAMVLPNLAVYLMPDDLVAQYGTAVRYGGMALVGALGAPFLSTVKSETWEWMSGITANGEFDLTTPEVAKRLKDGWRRTQDNYGPNDLSHATRLILYLMYIESTLPDVAKRLRSRTAPERERAVADFAGKLMVVRELAVDLDQKNLLVQETVRSYLKFRDQEAADQVKARTLEVLRVKDPEFGDQTVRKIYEGILDAWMAPQLAPGILPESLTAQENLK